MLCEICKKQEAVVYYVSNKHLTEDAQTQNICEGCFERIHPEASARSKELIKSGKSSVSGWTRYTPPISN